ncbi:MAG: hypothetical protein Q9162_003981 [Coniocarpon cinnabarinum]
MSDGSKDTSTLQSVVDNATGTLQSMRGSITGNQQDSDAGAQRRSEAGAKDDLSHSSARFAGYTATPEGGLAKDDERRSQGNWDKNLGALKESVGGFTGMESMRQSGVEQNQSGKEQEAAGQLSDLGGGAKDRAQGFLGEQKANFTGNETEAQRYRDMHDTGKAQQRGAESDIQKQNQ